MENQLLKSYVGKDCLLSMGVSGGSVKGRIVALNENWLEVEVKRSVRLINADYVSSVRPLE